MNRKSSASVDELAGDPEDVGGLGGGDFVLGSEHHDACAVGDLVEHRAHGGLDRGVAAEPVGQGLGVGPGLRALVVDALDDQAAAVYIGHDFTPFPGQPLRLFHRLWRGWPGRARRR